jgi:hypothetical protein
LWGFCFFMEVLLWVYRNAMRLPLNGWEISTDSLCTKKVKNMIMAARCHIGIKVESIPISEFAGHDEVIIVAAVLCLVHDADMLDHFGVFDVWRICFWTVNHEQPISETMDFMTKIHPTENENDKRKLDFDASKRIFDEKLDFLRQFTNRFAAECAGAL